MIKGEGGGLGRPERSNGGSDGFEGVGSGAG